MRVRPARRLRGRVSVPGDKSISHRAAIIAALARGRTRISNFSSSADCASTLRCLEQLGVRVERESDATIIIEGVGCEQPGRWDFREPAGALDCGNSGTTMRLLAGVLAAQPFAATLTGDVSLNSRPMRRIIEPLELMGARVSSEDGHAPLRVEGRRPLAAIEYEMSVPSAQVKSSLLLAGLGAEGQTRVAEWRVRTRDHTERMLQRFGVPVGAGTEYPPRPPVWVEGPASLTASDVDVPGDISSAAFLIAAVTLLPGSDLRIEGVGVNWTRTMFLDSLRAIGGEIQIENQKDWCNEPAGDLHVRGVERLTGRRRGRNPALSLKSAFNALVIDELPLLAVVGTQVEGGVEIRDAGELRLKESDRIRATVQNLRVMGAEVEEYRVGLRVHGPVRLRGARLDSFGDHRIAMAFAVAALIAEDESEIEGAEDCVGVSFPGFFPLLETLVER